MSVLELTPSVDSQNYIIIELFNTSIFFPQFFVKTPILFPYSFQYCCDMGQNDTIGKIELKIIFRLAVGISNSRNDIQLLLQLFDELRVNGDYH